MPGPTSYLLCGTPRTGSTWLCSLLASTGVAGRPESYFREPDQQQWAARLGVPITGSGHFDFAAFVAGAVRFGSTSNGVFGARVMWGTMSLLVQGLAGPSKQSDIEVLQAAFGPLRFVHLRRRDIVGQAVSWTRAEQSGHWQDGDESGAEPRLDLHEVDGFVRAIHEHNAGWEAWFAAEGIEPLDVCYEALVTDPGSVVRSVLSWIGTHQPPGWEPSWPHRRQADAISDDWVRRYRESRGGADEVTR
jgi:trehalose 2-sulfotransferase